MRMLVPVGAGEVMRGLFAGGLSLVLAHRHVISLDQQWPHFRFKRLVTGVEHAHPEHPAIHRVRHYLIQGSKVVVAGASTAFTRTLHIGKKLWITEERTKRLLADANIQAK